MNKKDFALLNTLMSPDSQGSSCHFALMRGLAEIALEYDHLARRRGSNEVVIPLGLLVLKWVLYYFAIVDNDLPQKAAAGPWNAKDEQLVFQSGLKKVTQFYRSRGGCEAFYDDLLKGGISAGISKDLIVALRQIRDVIEETILRMGQAYSPKRYTIICYNRDTRHIMEVTRPGRIIPEFLIQNFGTFTIRRNVYEVLRSFGNYLTGSRSIINQWALLTANATPLNPVPVNQALSIIAAPLLHRQHTVQARRIYEEIARHGVELRCVWSGRLLDQSTLAIDHIIPFSLLPNNDLWNLMPCHNSVNIRKGDRIPAGALLAERSEILQGYWSVARDFFQLVFDRQFKTSLVGFDVKNYEVKWQDAGFAALKNRCSFYVDGMGVESWNP